MRRRDFLKLVATTSTGAVLFTGCGIGDGDPAHEFKTESPVLNPVDVNFGRDNWYATACSGCDAGCGLVVRVFEGRGKKVEGNPDFPTNLGASCARAQSLVQELYHPDRIKAPMALNGPRGSGNYKQIDWATAYSQLQQYLGGASGGGLLMITEPQPGPLGQVTSQFVGKFGGKQVSYEPEDRVVLREAVSRVFGTTSLPTFDLASSDFLLNFGADFLHGWISPVQLSQAFGKFRQGAGRARRGTYYHVGPQLSGSAASADRWLPIIPGTEGLVALSVAQVMTSTGKVDSGLAGRVYSGITLSDYTPDKVAAMTGLQAAQITDLANRFAAGKPSVAIGGTTAAASTNALFNLTAIYSLNLLVGNVGKTGGVILNPGSPFGNGVPGFGSGLSYKQWSPIISSMNSGAVKLLMVHGANPAYHLPTASGFQQALGKVGKIVALSTVMDDTAMQADLILPVNTSLEDWGIVIPDPGPGYQTVALQQPVVQPFVDSKPYGDILITAASSANKALPWNTYEDAVKAAVESLHGMNRGNVQGNTAAEYLIAMQTQGGWWDTGRKATATPSAPTKPTPAARPKFSGDAATYPLYMLPYPPNGLDYGQGAHLPWLQALPEPISTNVWTTWVELNPKTASKYGVGTGDVVKVVSPKGSHELPVYVNPAAAPNLALIPMGQGHTAYGRYAEKRGFNVLELIDPLTDSDTGALAWAATRVKIETTGKKVRLPRFEGQIPAFQVAGAPIIEVIPPKP